MNSNLLKTLKKHVDKTVSAGVVSLVTNHETRIESPKSKEFRGERNAQGVEKYFWQI